MNAKPEFVKALEQIGKNIPGALPGEMRRLAIQALPQAHAAAEALVKAEGLAEKWEREFAVSVQTAGTDATEREIGWFDGNVTAYKNCVAELRSALSAQEETTCPHMPGATAPCADLHPPIPPPLPSPVPWDGS